MRVRAVGLLVVTLAACTSYTEQAANPNTALTPATHKYFPITSGFHAVDCNVCHGPFPSFQQFTCFNCHGHEVQASVDSAHLNMPGYSYTSAACYHCHPDGKAAGVPPGLSGDPKADVDVQALLPSWSGTTITSVTPQTDTLVMQMLHGSSAIPADALSACTNCHGSATTGSFYPGVFHASLTALGLPQPTQCGDCHLASIGPQGFVGPTATNPVRTPSSGEMRHDAVAWSGSQSTGTALVTEDCATCHQAPAAAGATWAVGASGSTPATFHASLAAAGLPQPGSCLDCHANSRPTSTSSWTSSSYTSSPFDYVTNADGVTHGGGQDCAACHTSTSTWAGGHFPHGAGTLAATTCIACHMSQRPDLQPGLTAASAAALLGFDHSQNGTGDCAGCHQATVSRGHYVNYLNPATGKLPGGDWTGGLAMPPTITVGGFPIPQPPAGSPTTQATETLPHPSASGGSCATCHAGGSGGKNAIGYDHANLPAGSCNGCHEAGSDFVATPWNGATSTGAGSGDTRPFTLAGVTACKNFRLRGCNTETYPNHFYPVDCYECHYTPASEPATTASASMGNWSFPHDTGTMSQSTCVMCHTNGIPN